MSLPNYLAKIKSAGVYRYVFDKSDIPEAVRDSIRLVVGYSEKGPFNTPVYIDSATDFVRTFGNISRRMERKGIFFHRMALQALEAGPIVAFNAKPFNEDQNNPEVSTVYAFNASDVKVAEGESQLIPKVRIISHCTEGRVDQWNDVNMYQVYFSGNLPGGQIYYSLSTDPNVTIKYTETFSLSVTQNSDVTVTAWYADENGDVLSPYTTKTFSYREPRALYETVLSIDSNDLEPWVVTGLSTEIHPRIEFRIQKALYEDGSEEPSYRNYHADIIMDPADIPNPNIIDLLDLDDSNIKTIVFDTHAEAGGYQADGPTTTWTMKKNDSTGYWEFVFDTDEYTPAEGYQQMHGVSAKALVAERSSNKDKLTAIYDTNRFWKVDAERIHAITALQSNFDPMTSENDYIRIVQTGSEDDSCTVFVRPYVPTNWNVKISDWYSSQADSDMPAYMEAIKDHYLSEFFVEIFVFKGDLRKKGLYDETGTLGSYTYENGEAKWQGFCVCPTDGGELQTNIEFKNAYGEYADALDAMSDVETSNFINRYAGICFPSFRDANGNFIDIASVFNRDYQEHKMLLGMNEALLDEAYDYDLNGDGDYEDDGEEKPKIHGEGQTKVDNFVHALCSAVVAGGHNLADLDDDVVFNPVHVAIKGLYMPGYRYNSIQRKDKDEPLQEKIFHVFGYKGIFEALTNNIDIDYKYLIDTFQTYPALAMKAQLSTIVKKKFNALALLNFPPMLKVLDKCGWKDYKGGFDMKAILKKGDISLPSEAQGASWAAFYTQLQMTDGSVKFIVPSAALVSNLFMTKREKRLPYYIVAGPNYGRIDASGVLGPDYNYARADLDVLEPFGVNAIIHIPRQGIVINGNQTAKQTPITSLSKVHVRELVTFLQDELENMLLGYQWELNTATLRDMVRSKAEVILGLCQANGGIYDFKVTCDDSNNTTEVINNSMLVLDVDIIAARGTEKIVQTLTLHRIGTDLSLV